MMRVSLVLMSILIVEYSKPGINPKPLLVYGYLMKEQEKQQKISPGTVTKAKSRNRNGRKESSERLGHLNVIT